MCCDWLRKLFKETEIKPVKVPRAKVDRYEISRTKIKRYEVTRAEIETADKRLTRLKYMDTGEIVELDLNDKAVFEEVMTNERPVEILGFVR